MIKLAGFAALMPLLMIVVVILIVVAVSKAKKKKGQNTPAVTPPPVAYAAPPAVPTEEDRQRAEIAALSYEEVHRRYCDVEGRSDAYRYLCYEELERRKGKSTSSQI